MLERVDGSRRQSGEEPYLLGRIWSKESGKGIESVRTLDEKEADGLSGAIADLHGFFNQPAYVLVRQTLAAFYAIYQTHSDKVAKTLNPTSYARSELVFDLNSRLALWLESFRLFLNHTETELKRRYGEHSEQWESWARTKSGVFDSHFAYRFMYHLRNYLHVRMPISRISMRSWEVEPGVVVGDLQVAFSRDQLLEGYKWHPKVREDLVTLDEDFPVLPLVQEMAGCIDQLMLGRLHIQLPNAVTASKLLEGFVQEALTEDSQPAMMRIIDLGENGKRLNMELKAIPMEWLPLVERAQSGVFTIFGTDGPMQIP